jgi:hypothetical protein
VGKRDWCFPAMNSLLASDNRITTGDYAIAISPGITDNDGASQTMKGGPCTSTNSFKFEYPLAVYDLNGDVQHKDM